jgi:signal transduction histidine kinase
MKKEILLATLGYVMSVALLLSFLYWLLKNEGFDEKTFLAGSIVVLLLSVGWGYIIASHLVIPHRKTQDHLLHLTKDIVHELNIPLSTIQANSAMLSKNMEEERARKRLKRIDDASLRLKKLYDQLVYTIRKEMHQIEREPFDLAEMVVSRVEVFKEQRRNPFILELETCRVYTDRIGFERIFDNLVANAMKYSDKHTPVTIRIEGEKLEIIDRGIGMDEAQLLQIYERYYQGDSQKEGEGIGLALVKAYCDQEDIVIQVSSKPGEGTRIVLQLEKILNRSDTVAPVGQANKVV